VKVTQYLTQAEDISAYTAVRKRVLGGVKPAFILLVVDQLVRPEFLVEVEVIAAKEKRWSCVVGRSVGKDKQKIAEASHVNGSLEEVDLGKRSTQRSARFSRLSWWM
jgi:hypothetical protein